MSDEEKDKLVLDEQMLDKLLEAAYVLQEHNRELQAMELGFQLKRDQLEAQSKTSGTANPQISAGNAAPTNSNFGLGTDADVPMPDYTLPLAQVVETQHQIQIRHLDLEGAMGLVATRLREITSAAGAAVGIFNEGVVRYGGTSGEKALPRGTAVKMNKALCLPCLRTGQAFRCADVNTEFLVDTEECHRRDIQSMIAVPVFQDDEVAGGLELYYATTEAFSEQDVHTCQLMAGLITEALAREKEAQVKHPIEDERAAVLEALEKLQPNLQALVEQAVEKASAHPPADATKLPYEPPSLQSKVASAWHMQEAKLEAQHHREIEEAAPSTDPKLEAVKTSAAENAAPEQSSSSPHSEVHAPAVAANEIEIEDHTNSESTNPDSSHMQLQRPPDWSSAAAARDFLEQVISPKKVGALAHFWTERRGDIYLGVAILLVICAIRWGIWANRSAPAAPTANTTTSRRVADPMADLSFFDRMLVNLGLADPPEQPEDKGNPATQVWVDLRTALYYCPGADEYGKTATGKFTSQRDAEIDQFQPAFKKVCP